VIDGYPDRPDELELALHRVEAVRDALVAAGVDPDQVVIAAFDQPATHRVVVTGTRQPLDAIVAAHGAAGAVVAGR
jgi:hypothetical protein